MSNIKPGVCGICGIAVVRVFQEKHGGDANIDGHIYKGDKLIRVRCYKHTASTDNAPSEDAQGGSGEFNVDGRTKVF